MVMKRTIAAINRWYKTSPTVYTVAAINGCICSVVLYGSYRYYSPLWPGEVSHILSTQPCNVGISKKPDITLDERLQGDWLWLQQQTPQEMERYRRGIGEVSIINDGDFI